MFLHENSIDRNCADVHLSFCLPCPPRWCMCHGSRDCRPWAGRRVTRITGSVPPKGAREMLSPVRHHNPSKNQLLGSSPVQGLEYPVDLLPMSGLSSIGDVRTVRALAGGESREGANGQVGTEKAESTTGLFYPSFLLQGAWQLDCLAGSINLDPSLPDSKTRAHTIPNATPEMITVNVNDDVATAVAATVMVVVVNSRGKFPGSSVEARCG